MPRRDSPLRVGGTRGRQVLGGNRAVFAEARSCGWVYPPGSQAKGPRAALREAPDRACAPLKRRSIAISGPVVGDGRDASIALVYRPLPLLARPRRKIASFSSVVTVFEPEVGGSNPSRRANDFLVESAS